MYCVNCGANAPEGASFCPSCGKPPQAVGSARQDDAATGEVGTELPNKKTNKLLGCAGIGFGVFVLLGIIGSALDTKPETPPQNLAGESATKMDATVDTPPPPAEEDNLTGPQRNAVRSAEQYLSISGFSREGLIQQLSSDAGEGYSVADATAAVDSLNVDWNENAAKSARQYLSISGFSCQGLIEQLSSSAGDNYTVEQATYGARQAGAC